MRTTRFAPFLALAATCALALSACGAPQVSPPSASPSDTTAAVSSSGGPASSGPTSSPAAGPAAAPSGAESAAGVDALTLTGPAEAATVPDVQPLDLPRGTDTAPQLPTTVTDARGDSVRVESADRLLALDLNGTLTDTVIGLGLAENLVGRSNSDTQAVLQDLPVVTQAGHDLNTEAVLELDPTLVLTTSTVGSEEKYAQLEAAGVSVVRFETTPSLDAIGDTIEAVGAAVGLPAAAEALAERTEEELERATATVDALRAATPTAPRAAVLYVRGTAGVFFILGRDQGAADILAALGLEDVAEEHGITSLKPANAEALMSLDPQVVLAMKDGVKSTGGVDGLLARPGMAATSAGASRRVITAADGQLLAYGPRTPANLVALAQAIYTQGEPR